MRQKCVRNASKWVLFFVGEKRNVQNASEIRRNFASKMRQKCAERLWGRTPFGRYRSFPPRYDWATGVSDNGNEWRNFRVVPRSHPLRPLVLNLVFWGGNRRSRKEKAHEHPNKFVSGECLGERGGYPPGHQGSNVHVLCAGKPKRKIEHFRPGT